MYQIGPANGDKKTRPPPPPLASDSLSSTCDRQLPPYIPQSYTSVRQRMSTVNDSGGRARPSYRTHTSRNDAVGTELEESLYLARRFFLNQSVNVNVEGCGWLVGTVVFLAKTVQSLTGSSVRVRYFIPTERNERESGFPNHPDYIRPL